MALLDVNFEWPIDNKGYRPSADKKSIVRMGGSIRWHRPLEFHETLFLDFGALDGSPESCAEFASRFGFLGLGLSVGALPKPKKELSAIETEDAQIWRNTVTDMRHAVELWRLDPRALVGISRPRLLQITQLDAVLVQVPPEGHPALRIRPRTLFGAMFLQFAQAVSSRAELKTCQQCGRLFEAGGDSRRKDARFCSDTCRVNHHNIRKRSKS